MGPRSTRSKGLTLKPFFDHLIFDNAKILHCNLHIANLIGSSAVAQISNTRALLIRIFEETLPMSIFNTFLPQMTMNSLGNFNPANDPESMVSDEAFPETKHIITTLDSGQLSLRLPSSQTCGETPSKNCRVTRIPGGSSVSQSSNLNLVYQHASSQVPPCTKLNTPEKHKHKTREIHKTYLS